MKDDEERDKRTIIFFFYFLYIHRDNTSAPTGYCSLQMQLLGVEAYCEIVPRFATLSNEEISRRSPVLRRSLPLFFKTFYILNTNKKYFNYSNGIFFKFF